MQDDSPPPHQIDPWLKRALSTPKRVEVLGYLMKKRKGTSEGELADALGMTVPLALYHLRVLHDAELIAHVEDGEQGEAERSFIAATSAGL
jgi:DNA-binding transcriptional ArsR family regulator